MPAARSYKAKFLLGTRSFAARMAAVLLPGLLLGGCMTEMPAASLLMPASIHDPDVTGSIASAPGGMPAGEPAALREALSPEADGAPVVWFDPRSGLRGTVAADGPAFVSDDRLCRRFTAVVEQGGRSDRSAGSACRIGAGAWTVRERLPSAGRA